LIELLTYRIKCVSNSSLVVHKDWSASEMIP
jgi:hypothetical protein